MCALPPKQQTVAFGPRPPQGNAAVVSRARIGPCAGHALRTRFGRFGSNSQKKKERVFEKGRHSEESFISWNKGGPFLAWFRGGVLCLGFLGCQALPPAGRGQAAREAQEEATQKLPGCRVSTQLPSAKMHADRHTETDRCTESFFRASNLPPKVERLFPSLFFPVATPEFAWPVSPRLWPRIVTVFR